MLSGFSIEGPSQAPIECVDKGDGSCDVSYLPTVEGEYAIHVICDDEDIKMSPFMAMIVPNDSTTLCDAVSENHTFKEHKLEAKTALLMTLFEVKFTTQT